MGSVSKLISTKIGDFVMGTIAKRIGFNLEHTFYSPAGVDAVPLPKDKMFIEKKDGSGNYAILGSLMISQGAKEGELILYSRDSDGAVQSEVYLTNDGKFMFNGGSNPAARKDDPVKSTSAEDSAYWSFWSLMFGIIKGAPIPEPGNGSPSAFQAALALALAAATPSSLIGKITEGTEEVLLP